MKSPPPKLPSCLLLFLFLAVVGAQESRPKGAITGISVIDGSDTWVEVIGWVDCDDGPFVYRIGDSDRTMSSLDIAGCNEGTTRGTFRIPLLRTAPPGEPVGVFSTSSDFIAPTPGFFSFERWIDFILRIVDWFLRLFRLPWSVWSPSTFDTSLAVGDFVYRVPISLSELVSSRSSDTVTIPKDQLALWDATVDMDESILQVQGTLLCPQFGSQMAFELRTAGVVVGGSAARWECTIETVEWTVSLTGEREAVYDGEGLGLRAIVAVDGGILRWTGAPGKEGYYYLRQTAEVGSSSLRLDDANGLDSSWEVGDSIVVAPTDFSPEEAEERVITAIAGNQITLDTSLRYRHWGSTEFHSNGKGQSWILDERAEVLNLRRNIRIQAIDDDLTTTGQLGGHVMIKGGFGYLDNVEFYRMGQAGRLGRYPVHFHLSGDRTGNFVRNSSIHQSFSRCVSIHQTHNVKLEKNSCYDHFGHGFFLEDGNERGNEIIGNIGVLSKRPPANLALLASDITGDPLRFAPPATFWISHPDNIVRNNVASGSEGSGFWMAFVDNTGSGISPTEQPSTTNTLVFDNNIAHSMIIGITHDGAPTGRFTGNVRNSNDRALESAHYNPPSMPVFNDLVTYKCSGAGIYFRGSRAAYRNAVLADNSLGLFMAFDQEVENSLVVGISQNNKAASELTKYSGAMVYDGTNTRALDKIGPASMWTGQVRGITTQAVTQRIQLLADGTVWADEMCSSVHDIDGSLTGVRGVLAVPDHPWNEDERCNRPGAGAFSTLYCDYEVSYVQVADTANPVAGNLGFTSTRLRLSDNDEASISPSTARPLRNKWSMIQDLGYRYIISNLDLALGERYDLSFFTRESGITSPIVTLESMLPSCRILRGSSELPTVSSIAQLEQQEGAASFGDDADLVFRLASTANNPNRRGDTFRGEGRYSVQC